MSLLAALTVKVSAILLLALIAAFCLRKSSAAAKRWVLAVGVVSAVVAPALHVLPNPAMLRAAPVGALALDVLRLRPEVLFTEAADAGLLRSGVTPQPAGPRPDRPQPAAVAVATDGVVGRLAVTIWLVGAVASGGVLLVGFARLRWLRAASIRVTAGRWHRLCTDLAWSCGLKPGVTLLFGPLPWLAATWGWRRPAVMLPASASGWSAERMRVVLLHELAHARHGDWLLQMSAEALRCLWWFNPLAWIVRARLRRESEHAADDLVLAQGVPATTCAAHLVALAREVREHRRTWLPAPAMARPSHLERRLSAMLSPRTNRRPMTRLARFGSLGMLVLVSILVAGLQSGPVTAQDTMFRVDYVKTRTHGATVLEREEGTHTFASTGHRPDGSRGRRRADDHGDCRSRDRWWRSPDRNRLRPRGRAHRRAQRRDGGAGLDSGAAPRCAAGRVHDADGDTERGARADAVRRRGGPGSADPPSLPSGAAERRHRRLWDYRFPNANPVIGLAPSLTLAESWLSTAEDGTPELRETRIVNVTEVEFDPDAFSFDPSLGFRVEDLWDVLGR